MREVRSKGGKMPADLQAIADKFDAFQAKDRELKKAVADAKAAVEREKRNVALSVGQADDIESLTGDVLSKDVDLNLTIGGQVKPYVMTLRKYELTGGTGRDGLALGRAEPRPEGIGPPRTPVRRTAPAGRSACPSGALVSAVLRPARGRRSGRRASWRPPRGRRP